MISSTFYWLFVVHFQSTRSPSLKINKVDSIVADSTFSTYIINTHSSKYDDEPVFVKNRWMIASCRSDFEMSYPSLLFKWVNLGFAKRITTMASNNNGHIFIDCSSVALSWLWFPALKSVACADHSILDIFMNTFCCWFFDDFSYLSIQSRQSLFLMVINVQYFLIFQWFLHIIV